MANKSEDHLIQCPYYRKNTGQILFCEGLEDGMTLHLAFDTHAHMIRFKGRFCRKDSYADCPIAGCLDRKWGYDDE